MDSLLLLLPALGCGVMMAACMYLMGRGMRSPHQRQAPEPDASREVAELREEVARLRAEGRGDPTHG